MQTDTIFYQLFLTFHSLLFELLGLPEETASSYQFTSVEVKEKAFRFDGIFMPKSLDRPIYLIEVQFQAMPEFYWEFIAEINIYLNQYKPIQDWQAVAIFARRSLEPKILTSYQQELINSGRIVRIYLDELASGSIGMGLIQLIISKEAQAPELVKQLMQRTKVEIIDFTVKHNIIELLESVLVSKFSKLSRQEIEAMFLLSDIKQTRVYQEAKLEGNLEGNLEGRQNEAKTLLTRMLCKRFGKLSDRHEMKITALNIEQLEELAIAFLDFKTISDLDIWLAS